MVKLIIAGNTIEYYTPYNPKITFRCRHLKGKWDGLKGAWILNNDKDIKEALNSLTKDTFGFGLNSKTATAYISFSEDVESKKSPYVVGGHVLSSARGRDTGARVGEDTLLLDGCVDSGGSFKNWTSTIKSGSKFRVNNFPVEYDLNSHEDAEHIRIEFVEFENDFDEDEVITFQVSSLVEKLVELGLSESQINSVLEL
jgi:hypothetical protein